jgi:hypothetical protein
MHISTAIITANINERNHGGPHSRSNATALVSTLTLVYRCDLTLFLANFVDNLVLLTAAILGTIPSHKANAPKTFGYYSSIIEDSPHRQGSEAGSAMSGFSRIKMF